MKGARNPLHVKCLTAAVAVALLAAPTVQAAASNLPVRASAGPTTELRSGAGPGHPRPSHVRTNDSAKSYFWREASITAGVLAGIFALGLWGDVAIGGVIFGIQLLCAGSARAARKVGARARDASRWVGQVAGSNPARASSR
jgi:hypothetical protein